jgi:sec-independent protein translocase protein TatB
MFGLSLSELLIIAVLALILLGPDRLPDAARTLGKGMRQIQRATQDLKDEFESHTQGLANEIETGTRDLKAQIQDPMTSEELKAIPSLLVPVPGREPDRPPFTSPLAALPVPGRDAPPAQPQPPTAEMDAVEPPPGTSQA